MRCITQTYTIYYMKQNELYLYVTSIDQYSIPKYTVQETLNNTLKVFRENNPDIDNTLGCVSINTTEDTIKIDPPFTPFMLAGHNEDTARLEALRGIIGDLYTTGYYTTPVTPNPNDTYTPINTNRTQD